MKYDDFGAHAPGHLQKNMEGAWSFVPDRLPPLSLPADWGLIGAIDEARGALSELNGVAATLPNPLLLVRAFERREATASSRIEGTEAGLRDLVLFEVDEELRPGDAREIANYLGALRLGMARMREMPLHLNLLCEMHALLLRGVRGEDKTPGRFRTRSVWIGARHIENARFVPPPADDLERCLRDFERFLHEPSELPVVVRLALIHYQFETIHPFLDGNGRIGRLLIPLLLCQYGLLREPLLYLSAWLERHKDEYFDLMLGVSQQGQWHPWLRFFLRGVAEESRDGVARAHRLIELRNVYRERLTRAKASASVLSACDFLFESPALSVSTLAGRSGLSFRGAQLVIEKLQQHGLISEETGRQRNRVFLAGDIVDIISREVV